ncbi:hypothetical protein PR202_gb02838 [Eleusine coracana subsp. coracana]|uniref:Uncharacterized protein n=1 Tax=Eleusine coracana subsp. coracana TaxID=191504 RepID=A0AAV5E073_ELECO|nr:hypothetical protein PR202_gb02838 [Eleusine coracana subsp. coracana]
MGFDPMTHRPRTDFFAALPQLIALATLRDHLAAAADPAAAAVMTGGQVQPAGVDVAVQAAKLQYLQCLLQSTATTIATTTAAAAPDADETALGAAISSLHGTPPAGSTVPFSMAGAQVSSCTTTFEDRSELANQQGFSYGAADEMLACEQGGGTLPPLTDLSDAGNNNPGDGCSASSSFGDGSASSPLPWPEFFPDDPFITDFL